MYPEKTVTAQIRQGHSLLDVEHIKNNTIEHTCITERMQHISMHSLFGALPIELK